MTTTIATPQPAASGLHELIRNRWSPKAFSQQEIEPADLRLLLEAARWAPSSYNEQPWRFVVATDAEPETRKRLLGTLVEPNRAWAQSAPALLLAVARTAYSHNGVPNRHAWYDLGQAMAHLTFQATALGLYVHQMAGFDPRKAREAFAIPEGYEPAAVAAIGYLPSGVEAPNRRERKELNQLVFGSAWGKPAEWLGKERIQ